MCSTTDTDGSRETYAERVEGRGVAAAVDDAGSLAVLIAKPMDAELGFATMCEHWLQL